MSLNPVLDVRLPTDEAEALCQLVAAISVGRIELSLDERRLALKAIGRIGAAVDRPNRFKHEAELRRAVTA